MNTHIIAVGKSRGYLNEEALQDWMSKQKRKDFVGGIAIEHNGQWLLHSGKKYDWEKCTRGDWSDWNMMTL